MADPIHIQASFLAPIPAVQHNLGAVYQRADAYRNVMRQQLEERNRIGVEDINTVDNADTTIVYQSPRRQPFPDSQRRRRAYSQMPPREGGNEKPTGESIDVVV